MRSRMFRLKRIRLSGADVVAQDDLIRAEPEREQQLSPERSERDAAGSVVLGEDVVVAARVVELARARPDDHVVVGQLAEIDARLVDLQVDRGLRRQIADEQDRQSFAGHLVDRAERQAVAVREGQPLVDPRSIRQAGRVQLARRQHDLTQRAVDGVAIVVDRRRSRSRCGSPESVRTSRAAAGDPRAGRSRAWPRCWRCRCASAAHRRIAAAPRRPRARRRVSWPRCCAR